VLSFSDVDPGMFHLLDREKVSIEPLMKTREWLDPALMSERKFITYKARDGLTIPAWVTIPRNSSGKNLPLIVHVHGGPWARVYSGASQWGRPDAQFFASRGYVVLEPEPRGSLGFGKEHYTKSFRQWGLTMQDDITDGALHLVKEGIVDKSRMCLFGGSYGGYASAMGVVKDPELWKCAAPFIAVTDLFLLQGASYTDAADFGESEYFKKMVGDPRADKEMLTRSSPALNGSRVKAPVLLAMGSEDVRVPMVHGTAFRDAVKSGGGKVEFVVYDGEAHGWNKDENVFDFYRRLEKFFAENLRK
jgi:dipeptidyl aminopeptidase/acylaminoacyl peptidase